MELPNWLNNLHDAVFGSAEKPELGAEKLFAPYEAQVPIKFGPASKEPGAGGGAYAPTKFLQPAQETIPPMPLAQPNMMHLMQLMKINNIPFVIEVGPDGQLWLFPGAQPES